MIHWIHTSTIFVNVTGGYLMDYKYEQSAIARCNENIYNWNIANAFVLLLSWGCLPWHLGQLRANWKFCKPWFIWGFNCVDQYGSGWWRVYQTTDIRHLQQERVLLACGIIWRRWWWGGGEVLYGGVGNSVDSIGHLAGCPEWLTVNIGSRGWVYIICIWLTVLEISQIEEKGSRCGMKETELR